MKKFATMTLVLLMAIMCIAFAACDKTPEDTTPTEYKVTIDSQNGLKTRTVSVKIGETFDLPNQPYYQGMIFLGWYTTPSGQEGKKNRNKFRSGIRLNNLCKMGIRLDSRSRFQARKAR